MTAMTAPAPTPTKTRISMCTLSAGELTGILEVGVVVVVLFLLEEEVEVLVIVVEVVEVVVTVEVVEQEVVEAGTHETPLQVYPGPKRLVQY